MIPEPHNRQRVRNNRVGGQRVLRPVVFRREAPGSGHPSFGGFRVSYVTPSSRLVLSILLAFLLAGSGSVLGPRRTEAQEASLVDRIVAVVGDSVIVLSEVDEQMFQLEYRLRSQGGEMPPEGSPEWNQLQRDVLDQMIGEQLVVQAAARDTTILVDDVEVENLVSEEMNQRVTDLGGQQQFEAGLAQQGFTVSGYREFLRRQIRQQQLYQQYMAKRAVELSSIVVEESEIQDFFEAQKDAIGQRPPTVVFGQIILVPTPSDSVWQAALEKANEIYDLAAGGEDFAELAERFSDDPSKEGGGDLGWFRRGDMLPAFEDAAFNMVVDEISRPVRSRVGYHIIKVTRRRAGEIRASHILVLVRPSEADVQTTQEFANDLRARLQAGEDLEALRDEYGDPDEPDTLSVPFSQLSQLPPGFAEPLSRANPGDVLDPIRYEARGEARFSVVKVIDVLPAGPYSLDDAELRNRITQAIRQQKLLDKILQELRSKTYVQIRL